MNAHICLIYQYVAHKYRSYNNALAGASAARLFIGGTGVLAGGGDYSIAIKS